MKLAVNELFGPTLQGEGKSLGMPTMFLRLAGCNLACTWCDTRYAWDWSKYSKADESHPMSVGEVQIRLAISPVRNLVITGGEPMLQQAALLELTRGLHRDDWWTEMETAGTMLPYTTELVNQYNVSPKLMNSGNLEEKRYQPHVLKVLNETGRANFKFVVSSVEDFAEIDRMVDTLHLSPVYIMPEGITAADVNDRLSTLAGEVVRRGYYLTTRLHILLYGIRRGV